MRAIGIGLIILVGVQTSAWAEEPSDQTVRKNIYRGNYELAPELNFTKEYAEASAAYRHFFWDKVALGVIASGSWNKDLMKGGSLGLSGRWYFYETGRWAFSVTQNLMVDHIEYDGGFGWGSVTQLRGETRLGAHYFINEMVSVGLTIGNDYILGDEGVARRNGSIDGRFGLSVNF